MNDGLEGIHHNAIWPDESVPEPEPEPPTFESTMDSARNSLRRKIEDLIRARELRNQKGADAEGTEGADSR